MSADCFSATTTLPAGGAILPWVTEKSREVRLGLVMYGGVSLAVYINGVSREFYRAVRGESAYKLIKALTHSDVVVDIVSGTSAGGVNGLLLGYALCNDLDFSATAELWRETGSIAKLLRDPSACYIKDNALLDGDDYYQPQLEEAFRAIQLAGSPKDESADTSRLQEMDVFITSTDIDGRHFTWFDSQNHPVDVKDHRAVFQLKYRAGRKNDFEGDEIQWRALAKLARMTSCFPVAFPPVRLLTQAPASSDPYWCHYGKADALIAGWGRIKKKEAYFLDGGVLDNKPFSYTVHEIFRRLAYRPVKRVLFYVEPNPEVFDEQDEATDANVFQAACRALISIPGYESISGDLKEISVRNEQIRRFRRLSGSDHSNGKGMVGRAQASAIKSLDPDTKRFADHLRALESGGPPDLAVLAGQCLDIPYVHTRLISLSERAVRGVIKDRGEAPLLDGAQYGMAVELSEYFDRETSTKNAIAILLFHRYDAYFRLRRLFHVLYACPPTGQVGGKHTREENELNREVRYWIGRQIKLLEIILAAMEKLIDEGVYHWSQPGRKPKSVWRLVRRALDALLCLEPNDSPLPANYCQAWTHKVTPGTNWLDQASLDALHRELSNRVDELLNRLEARKPLPRPRDCRTILDATDACCRRMLEVLDGRAKEFPNHAGLPKLADTYSNFIYIDAKLFLLESFADLQEKDVISTVRISPRDAQRGFSRKSLKDKITGDNLANFGGFFKRSWRANDILWGRLDAHCQLVETLMERERVLAVLANPQLRADLYDRVASKDLQVKTLFPWVEPSVQQAIDLWLKRLLGDDPPDREAAASPAEWEGHLDLLVEAYQMEVMHEEVGHVLTDAVQEQMEWNHYKLGGRGTPGVDGQANWTLQQGNGRFDATVNAAAAAALSEQAMQSLAEPAKLRQFFMRKYRVGSETIRRDIPEWIMLEIVLRGLLVARNGLVSALPAGWRAAVKGSLIYRLLSGALWLLYMLASTLASSGRKMIAVRFALAGAIATALAYCLDILRIKHEISTLEALLLGVPIMLFLFTFRRTRLLSLVLTAAAVTGWGVWKFFGKS